jgi:hypothetical protein
MLLPRHYTDFFLTDHLFPTHFPYNMREHHGIRPNSNTSSYLSINSNLLTSLGHPTNSFVAGNNFPTHFLLNVREHHGILSVVSPWCLLGVPWDLLIKEHQGGTPSNTRGFWFCSGGDFPIPMMVGSVYYTPMYYNPTASDCILSPLAICKTSNGYLTRWTRKGSTSPPIGNVIFYNKHDKPVIQLKLRHQNGLFYTTTEILAVDNRWDEDDLSAHKIRKRIGIDEETLLAEQDLNFANLTTDAPTKDPRRLQLEADLWQARLGHCGEWQLKVISQAVDGMPSQFIPHSFSSYDHYNGARIRKMQQ